MSDAVRTEWIKLRTLAGTSWLLSGAVAVTVLASAGMALTTHVSPGETRTHDPTKLALIGADLGQAVIAVLAVNAIGEEYGTGMIRVTLAAVPRRELVLVAKALNVFALALLSALPAVAGCLIVGRVLLPGAGLDPTHGYPLVSIADGPTLRAALGSVLYLGLIALLGLGIAAIFRDTAVSSGIVLGLLYLPPLLALLVSGPWRRHIQQIAPMSAGLAIQATRNISALPITPWAGLGILGLWTGGMLIAGAAVLRVRDA